VREVIPCFAKQRFSMMKEELRWVLLTEHNPVSKSIREDNGFLVGAEQAAATAASNTDASSCDSSQPLAVPRGGG
jgi:hypothetical protein